MRSGSHFHQTVFQESQYGSVIEEIGRDKPTAAEWRNDQRRHTKPRPIGPGIGGLPITVGSGTAGAVTYSPEVPRGGVTGAT